MPATKMPVRAVSQRAAPRKTARTPGAGATAASPAPPAKPAKPANPAKLAKPAQPPKRPKAPRAAKAAKPPKLRTKPVRDSFTMPEADFALIATLKARMLSARRETKKSELLRAGLHALAALDTVALVAALGALEPVKIGRPKSGP